MRYGESGSVRLLAAFAAAGYFALPFQPNRAARAAEITVTSIACTLGDPDSKGS
jgi:hypothetical protein